MTIEAAKSDAMYEGCGEFTILGVQEFMIETGAILMCFENATHDR
jgi:hypothetical protein